MRSSRYARACSGHVKIFATSCPAFGPGIHVFSSETKAWMAATERGHDDGVIPTASIPCRMRWNCMPQTELIRAALQQTIEAIPESSMRRRISGKVRDVFEMPGDRLAIAVTDRISVFDYVIGTVPFK